MASSSSSYSPRTWRYNVFSSFHGPDVRKAFLSHLRKQFSYNGISMFDDQRIERSQTIAPELTQAIRESRISIVVLSENYASSSWCLDELVEILKCREAIGQIVMTVFYGVDPSHVRKQTGDFGKVFKKTCASKTEEERRSWSQALNDVGNIAGEYFLNWDNEAKMIEKIAKDVLDKLNATPSKDFDDMVGLEAHLREMMSLLDLDYDGVKVVAIYGPAGIGKTTIARALHSRLVNRFQLDCFEDNLRGSYQSGFDEYSLKLRLQEQFLSKVLNHNGMRICHLDAVRENLSGHKVLIILDDVNSMKQLEALANETTWFGPGSRIVVTTENKELLQQHDINNIYHVRFPTGGEALEILCRYAFRQSYPHDGFRVLALQVTELCGNLPLGLRVVGSSLRGKNEEEWEDVMNRLETILDRDIEEVLRVGYESLHENEQILFLHIAVFFNRKDSDLVKDMFADGTFLDFKLGLKILLNRSLIEIDHTDGERIEMHKLLQQMAREVIRKQKPWKRQILTDAHEICDVLENEICTRAVSGISFDISRIDEVSISERAFIRMSNLRFLRVYKSKDDGNDKMHIPEGMEFPRRLRLLDWKAYPSKSLPPTFHPEYLVELIMKKSQLEYLWKGTQKLTNLKKMVLCKSYHLKELPDLSNATNLETLDLAFCKNLVEISSSFSHLQKLQTLSMTGCINLQVIPAHLNLASLESIHMGGCSKLRNFQTISTHITSLNLQETEVEDVSASISVCPHLEDLNLSRNEKLKKISHLPTSLTYLNLSNSDIKEIPDCIKALDALFILRVSSCRRLASLRELPGSLMYLSAEDCESLETVSFAWKSPCVKLNFTNCFKLGEQARRSIIRQTAGYGNACLPGREVPAEFDHRARGSSLTVHLDGNRSPLTAHLDGNRIIMPCTQVCLVVSPKQQIAEYKDSIRCRVVKDDLAPVDMDVVSIPSRSICRKEHLFIFSSEYCDTSREIVFEFGSEFHDFDVIECGVQIKQEIYELQTDQPSQEDDDSVTSEGNDSETSEAFEDQVSENDYEDDDSRYELQPREASQDSLNSERTDELVCEGIDRWSWLLLCFGFQYNGKTV